VEVEDMSVGLLMVRVVVGLLMAAHGSQKLFGWFGGYGLTGTGGYFEGLGFRPGRLFAAAAGATEVVSGLLVALGLFGPVGPALMLSVMIVAAVSVHWHGVFAASNGVEIPLLYSVVAVALAFTGPGEYSLDAALRLASVWTPELSAAALVVALLAAVGNLAARRPGVAATA
jgi:putative oxidoreductase